MELLLGTDLGPGVDFEVLGGVVDILAVELSFVGPGEIESEIEDLGQQDGIGVPECVFYCYRRRHERGGQLDLIALAKSVLVMNLIIEDIH